MAFCNAKTYRRAVQENAVLAALLKAIQNPETVTTAQEIYRKAKAIPQDVVDYQKELQAQIAGIMQGASPDAYAEVFADIAARRHGGQARCVKPSGEDTEVSGGSPAGGGRP